MWKAKARRWLRAGGFVLTCLAGALVLLGLALVVLLHNERTATWTAERALKHIRLYPGAALSLDGLRVSRQGVEVQGIALLEDDGRRVAGIRATRARARWWDLLHGQVVIDSLQLVEPRLDLQRLLDGLSKRPASAPAARADSEPARPARLRVGHLVLRDGNLESTFRIRGRPAVVTSNVDLEATDLRIGSGIELQIDSLQATSTFGDASHPIVLQARGGLAAGRIDLGSARIDSPTSHLELHGSAPIGAGLQALIANLQLDLVARPLDGRDLAPFVTIPPAGGRIEAEIHVALQGAAPVHTSGVTHVETSLQWGATRIPNLRLDVDWRDGRAELRLESEIDDRRFGMRGTCRPFDATVPYDLEIDMPAGVAALRGDIVPADGPSWRITRGSVRRLDVSRFAAAVPATDLTLELVASGRGTKPDRMSLQAAIDLVPSRIGSLTVDSLHVRGELQAGELTLQTHGGVCGTTLALAGKARPFVSGSALQATLRFARFDLARWFPDTRPTTDLQGSVTIEGTGWPAAARRADVRLVLEASRVGDQALRRADLHLAMEGAELIVEGGIDLAPDGGIEIAARGRPFDAQPRYTVRDLKFAAVDLAALLQKPSWRSRLNGHASLEGSGRTATTTTAHGRLDLDASMLLGVAIDAAHGDAGYQAGAADLDLDLQVPGGSGSVRGTGTLLGPDPRWQASAAIQSEDLARVFDRELPPGSFAAEVAVEGHGRDPVQGTGKLTGRGQLGEARLDSLGARVRLIDTILHVDSLIVRSNVLRLAGAGALQLPRALPPAGDSLHVEAEILDPAPLAFLFGERKLGLGKGQCTATVVGEPDAARFEAEARMRELRFQTLRAAAIQFTAQGGVDAERRPQQLAMRAQFDTLRVADIEIPTGNATAAYDGSVAHLRAEVAADAATRLHLAAHGPLQKAGEATLDTLVLQTASDHWDLERPVRIAYGPRVEVDRFDLRTGNRSIRFDGVIDPHGEHRFEAHLDSLELAALSTFFGWRGFSGNLAGELKVEGAASAPRAAGAVNLALRKDGAEIGALQSRFTQANGILNLTARVTNPEQDSLVVAGVVPRPLPGLGGARPAGGAAADAPLDLRVRADDFRVDALSVLFPASKVRDVHGQLWLDATVTGTRRSPQAHGQIRLQAGAARLPLLGVTYHDVQLTATLDGNRIHLEQLTAASDPGNIRVAGDLDLGSRALQIDAHLERFRAVYNRRLHVEASGDLAAKGTLGEPTITGSLTLSDTDIDISSGGTTGAQAVQLTEADLRMLEDNFGYRPRVATGSQKSLLEAVALGIVVEAGPDTWVRRRASPRLALEMSGSVDIRKKAHAPLETFGRLEVLSQRSYAEQLGRRFDVETGILTLNGDPNKAQIDFTAKWELPSIESSQPEVTVHLAAKGTMNDLRLRFTSDPAMDETQILTCLTTGRPPASAVGQASANAAGTSAGTAIALGQAAGAVEDIGAGVGLDVLQVRDDGVRGATVVAGSYVNPKTYLGVRQSATFENQGTSSSSTGASTEVELEYVLMKWLVANFQGGVSDIRFMFRSRYSY